MIGPVLSPEFAASAEASPNADGLEAASPVSPTEAAPAVGGTGRPQHVWLRADQIVAGDVVVPKYGPAWSVESSQRSPLPGFWQVRSSEGRTRLVVLPETQVLVRA